MGTITPGTASSQAATGNSTTQITVSMPATAPAGNLLVVIIGAKPETLVGDTTPPTGWTYQAAASGTGGTGTFAADTGLTSVSVYTKVADGTEAGGTVNFAMTGTNDANDVVAAVCIPFGGTDLVWEIAGTKGDDTTTGTPFTATGAADPGLQSGDYLIAAGIIPTDVTTPAQFSAETLSATGATFGAVTEVIEFDTTLGYDLGGVVVYAPVTGGPSSSAPTFSATAGGTTTNVAGPIAFLRIRNTALVATTVAATSTVPDYLYGFPVEPGAYQVRGLTTVQGVASIATPARELAVASATSQGSLDGTVVVGDDRVGYAAIIDSPLDGSLVGASGIDVVATLYTGAGTPYAIQAQVSTVSDFATTVDDATSELIGDGDQVVIPLTGLSASTTYYVRARAGDPDADLWSEWTTTVTVATSSSIGEGYAYLYASDVDTTTPTPHIWWTTYDPDALTIHIVGSGFGATSATYGASVQADYVGGTTNLTILSWSQTADANAGAARTIDFRVGADAQYDTIVAATPTGIDDQGIGVTVILADGPESDPGYGYGPDLPADRPNTGWWVEIRDFFDPDVRLATLHNYKELSFTKPLGDVGIGSVTFSRDDPIREIMITTTDEPEGRALLTFPSYWSFYQDGAERFRMLYEGKAKDISKAGEPESIIITGTGRATELSWAPVLPHNWPTNDKARPRKWNDSVWAESFVTLFNEAVDRGEIVDLTLTFTRTHDSYGMPWTILGDREIEIGENLLDLLQTTADVEEFDWFVSATGKVHAAPILGQDLSMTVRFFQATSVNEIGGVEDRRDLRNRVYVEGTTGRVSVVDHDLSQGRWGMRAMYLRSDEANTQRQRLRVARGTLRATRHPTREKSVRVPIEHRDPVTNESYGRTLFVDYGLGDTIGIGPKIDNESGQPVPQRDVRVQEIAVTVADGQAEAELVFESRSERTVERARRLLQQRFGAWSSAKTARQGKTPVANLRDTDAEFPIIDDALVFNPNDGLWHNNRPMYQYPFFYFGAVDYTGTEMYVPVDADRTIRRVTARLAVASSSQMVLELKRNDVVVHTMTIPAGAKRHRDAGLVIPINEDDDLSLAVVDPGSGAENLQYIAEAGI
jgi:hypothetical protein